jgi:hypothetical protein
MGTPSILNTGGYRCIGQGEIDGFFLWQVFQLYCFVLTHAELCNQDCPLRLFVNVFFLRSGIIGAV